jgi:chorismate synthase
MNTIGHILKLTVWGESHGPAMGGVLDGLPAGLYIDASAIKKWMARRWPDMPGITPRKEMDDVVFLSGVNGDRTTGAPLAFMIRNTDVRSKEYSWAQDGFRPGAADLGLYYAHGEHRDARGGGYVSGRATAAITAAGAIVMPLLQRYGVSITSRLSWLDGVPLETRGDTSLGIGKDEENAVFDLLRLAEKKKRGLESEVEVFVCGYPLGIGSPLFAALDSDLAHGVFAIPGVKGVLFPQGGAVVSQGGVIKDTTGISGGFSVGDIAFRALFKPPPSQGGVVIGFDGKKKNVSLRSDVCIAPRAMVVVESMVALTLLDHWMLRRTHEFLLGSGGMDDLRSDIDEIDRRILDLIAQRTGLAQDFAREKKKKGLGTKDEHRMQERRDFFKRYAARLGMDEEAAAVLADSLMLASIKRQDAIRGNGANEVEQGAARLKKTARKKKR